ncbi:MAG TPA: SUMF1/EgtB/PvdO family nonheme iron enzyme, partial [Chitinivibrionales bacterium]
TFPGTLVSIDDEYLKLNINGSVIPLAKTVINKIATPSTTSIDSSGATTSGAQPKKVAPVVFDTLIVKNKETDEYGKAKENIVLVGTITQETNTAVSFTTKDNVSAVYPFSQIVQLFRHSQEIGETDLIRRYAQTLICPPGMMLVDIPPGKTGRPFLKVCIDKYEFPNKEGTVPQVNISYAQAQALCQKQEKRLCTAQEWQWACSGLEGYTYSYGFNFDKTACNTDGRFPDPSGRHNHCIGKFGAMDMVGNVFEWVQDANDKPAAMGGPLSKCQTVSPGSNGDPKPQTGFRCCKNN